MLYISRRIAHIDGDFAKVTYGVVDTDDNVETVVSADMLHEAVSVHGLKIGGYETDSRYIVPYQHKDSMRSSQAKIKMMCDVDVAVWGSYITRVRWSTMSDGVIIRLSDFGTLVSDFVIFENPSNISPVTLVLDDRLKSISEWAFRMDTRVTTDRQALSIESDFIRESVRFDLFNLHNNKLASCVYRQMANYGTTFPMILDTPERRGSYMKKYAGR